MKDVVIYDPIPVKNDYLSPLYFESLHGYMRERGINTDMRREGLLGIRDKNILINAQHLNPEVITQLKNNGNSIFSFDINDSSWLCDTYRCNKEVEDINAIFTVSGVQDTQSSTNLVIDENFNYKKEEAFFAQGEDWERYNRMNKAGKVLSLPYVIPNSNMSEPIPSYENRQKSCLIRGGNHYLRFHLFLNLVKHGLTSINCGFLTSDYFLDSMVAQFKYCDDCKSVKRSTGRVLFTDYKSRVFNCNRSEAKEHSNEGVYWNNRCIPLFYWLTEQFEKSHGEIDKSPVENALNAGRVSENELSRQLAQSLFYGDFKWMFSIYCPPRFWEAARTKTISIVPSFTKNQTHYPEIKENDHYISYEPDFSDLDKFRNITKEQYTHITNNCSNLYARYIYGDRYRISAKLMDHIISKIDQFS